MRTQDLAVADRGTASLVANRYELRGDDRIVRAAEAGPFQAQSWPSASSALTHADDGRVTGGSLRSHLQEQAQALLFSDPNAFRATFSQAFGDKAHPEAMMRLESMASRGELPLPEQVRFVDRQTLNGANGAYLADDGGTVLLARDLRADPDAALRVFTEEVGHHLDAWLGGGDSLGDEGAVFAEGLLNGGRIDATMLAAERADVDQGSVTLDGRQVAVEFNDEGNGWSRWGHLALDGLGFIPVIGAAADGINAVWYAAEGDYENAALSAAAAVPGVGDAAAAVKLGVRGADAARGIRAADEAAEAAARAPIWSQTGTLTLVQNAYQHWKKHGADFPQLRNAKEYAEAAREFVTNPPPGTLTKTRPNGDTLFYEPSSNTFAVRNAQGSPRTMFKPKDGMDYWNRQ